MTPIQLYYPINIYPALWFEGNLANELNESRSEDDDLHKREMLLPDFIWTVLETW